jgi:hypothetical protein
MGCRNQYNLNFIIALTYNTAMNSERTKLDQVKFRQPIFNPQRAVDIGLVSIDPRTGWGMWHSGDGSGKWSRFTPGEITLLRVLGSDQFTDVENIAVRCEITRFLNKAMLTVTSCGSPEVCEMNRSIAEKMLTKIDELYNPSKPKALGMSEVNIRVAINSLRKKVGRKIIETDWGRGYRLGRSEDVSEE